jgi:hypothetical protein
MGFLVGLADLDVIDLDIAIVSTIAGKMPHISGSLSTSSGVACAKIFNNRPVTRIKSYLTRISIFSIFHFPSSSKYMLLK